jgi:hypothetical protein
MIQNENRYEWSVQDKLLYVLALIPFLVAFVGATYLLGSISIYLTLVLLGLYLLANLFQAGCCVGCPYQGRYCPAIFGVYPANWLSTRIYAHRQHDSRFFHTNATLAEITVVVMIAFAGLWLATLSWWFVVALFLLLAAHMLLFLTLICPKCSYSDTCPAGKTACKLFRM